MPHVIFVAPNFPANQRRFVEGLKKVGARVTGLGDTPKEHLDSHILGLLDGYEYVRAIGDVDAMTKAVQRVQRQGPWVHHLESTVEVHMMPTAKVRQRCGIPGLTPEQVDLCRDKFRMKRFLSERGIPCAKNAEVSTPKQAHEFVKQVGYPVILKPRDGAGAHATYRLDNEEQLLHALAETGLEKRELPFTMEQFISGHEGFFDTLTVNGDVQFEAVTHYYPNVLEAMRTRWISPQMVVSNRIHSSGYDELRQFGRQVVSALGLNTTATHMEWFASDSGLVFSEIGARPPGCNHWDLYCEANDIDLYSEWARGICYGVVEERASRRFAAGLINLRPTQDGRIVKYVGVERMQARYGDLIFKLKLPPVGSRTMPVEAGYLANAYVAVKHRDYDVLRAILDDIGQTVKVIAA